MGAEESLNLSPMMAMIGTEETAVTYLGFYFDSELWKHQSRLHLYLQAVGHIDAEGGYKPSCQ